MSVPSVEIIVERPIRREGLLRRLFGSLSSALISLVCLAVLTLISVPLIEWAVIGATWIGTAETCRASGGACWAFVADKARFIFFGLYPQASHWQALLATALVLALVIITAIPRFWSTKLLLFWPIVLWLAVALMAGAFLGAPISTQQWGGFPLTVLLTIFGFGGAFPFALLLALGRRSKMAVVRGLSIGFIEMMRGVPMIGVLYFSTLLLPLMLPNGSSIDKLLRAQITITLFVAAYMAEIIRAGLQAVPPGQYEASRALGLSWIGAMRLVVLPQALRLVIPAFVTLGIGIFLDTTLVAVIGLFDFLNTARLAATDANWLGFYNEAYLVVAVTYFIIAYGGSRYSLWLEDRLRPMSTASRINTGKSLA